ncbi:EAL domain-containing protein [Oceanicella actignis]|uniref:EAL domain-containing protein n=1 Tax=Oceanicella actignis TaxID=1189325 RepID=UPI0012572EAC|nr:EAL domain-containing protein [Oceanicella actignis]TYO88144.1 EAL domain-containing protein (putative c-di-GMP-specific phosphodiesterase class I) [Oceanicella actignis]
MSNTADKTAALPFSASCSGAVAVARPLPAEIVRWMSETVCPRPEGEARGAHGALFWTSCEGARIGLFRPADPALARGAGRAGFLAVARDRSAMIDRRLGAAGGRRMTAAFAARLAALGAAADEGMFLVPVLGDADAALARIRLLACAEPTRTEFGPMTLTLSAAYTDAEDAPLPALAAALPDALARALASGPERLLRADPRPSLASEALAALDEGRISLAYQPVVRTDMPLFPAFHETLIRVSHPGGAPIPAGRFMPEIEALGLSRLFDRRVLALALEKLRAMPTLRLSVNVAPGTLADPAWIEALEAEAALRPDVTRRLIVELTESGAGLRADLTLPFVRRARKTGCAIAIDDFGAGCTALSQLVELRPDILKLDGSLVRGMAEDPARRPLVEAVLRAARALDIMTVAEFVETPEDAAALTEMGVDALQGHLTGRPAAAPATLAPKGRRLPA